MLFTPAMALVAALMKGHSEGRLEERLARYSKPKLLIVDEFGLRIPVIAIAWSG